MKKQKKFRKDLFDVACAGFILGIGFTFFVLQSIVDTRKKEKHE
jgi:hypothetical protein